MIEREQINHETLTLYEKKLIKLRTIAIEQCNVKANKILNEAWNNLCEFLRTGSASEQAKLGENIILAESLLFGHNKKEQEI